MVKKIIITEAQLPFVQRVLKENAQEVTFERFLSAMKQLLSAMISNTTEVSLPDFFALRGMSKSKIVQYLEKNGIVESADGGYRVPKSGFERKAKKMYIAMFERNTPKNVGTPEVTQECDGGMMAGGTSAASSGAFAAPMGTTPIKRKIHTFDKADDGENDLNEEFDLKAWADQLANNIISAKKKQMGQAFWMGTVTPDEQREIDEAMTTTTAGSYTYDAPVPFGDKDSLDHSNIIARSIADGKKKPKNPFKNILKSK